MPTFREIYFQLLKENNQYINASVIEELFCYFTKFSKSELMLNFDEEMPQELDKYIEELKTGKPIQYITKSTQFLGKTFIIDENVLIPRQETEQLVLSTRSLISRYFGEEKINVLDMCCGSGVIGLSLVNNNAQIDLSDISQNALKITKINLDLYKTKAGIYLSDLFKNIPLKKYDVIVSNPPYIGSKDSVDKQVLKYEPELALFASPSTYFYEEIFKQCKPFLNSKYIMAFEIGEDQKEKLDNLVRQYFSNVKYYFEKDIYEKDRFLYIIKE